MPPHFATICSKTNLSRPIFAYGNTLLTVNQSTVADKLGDSSIDITIPCAITARRSAVGRAGYTFRKARQSSWTIASISSRQGSSGERSESSIAIAKCRIALASDLRPAANFSAALSSFANMASSTSGSRLNFRKSSSTESFNRLLQGQIFGRQSYFVELDKLFTKTRSHY
jgi:hypothetical protein